MSERISVEEQKDFHNRFGKRVTLARCKIGLTQKGIAARAKISQAGLSAIESGMSSPSIDTAAKIACALGTTIGFLLGEEETK